MTESGREQAVPLKVIDILFGVAVMGTVGTQSGTKDVGQWFEERVNVYEDFKRIHQHEPAAKAWGISIIAGPGVEIDFGSMVASAGR